MIFSLEVLQAKHGDCLLLHYGAKNDPHTIVIDGGPAGVYRDYLQPRLMQIKNSLSPDSSLKLSMVMVSHLDDDHVNGILQLADDVDDNKMFEVNDIWVNTFDDIIGNAELPAIAALGASVAAAKASTIPMDPKTERSISAVIASTGQGRQLRDIATKLGWKVNSNFKKLKSGKAPLVRGDVKAGTIKWDQLKITVIHPDEQRLIKLQKQWDKDLEKARKTGDKTIPASLTSPDTSPFNLSSIVCLVELGGKKVLLTGDGRSDDILAGLEKNKLLDKNGKLHVDVLKMPHHGSGRNMEKKFLQKVTGNHYVISADGNYDNPDDEVLNLFLTTVKKGELHLTNKTGKKGLEKRINNFVKSLSKSTSKLKISFMDGSPIVINLLDEIDF
jgi:beta-lactamase superfamily II metal-dependent hydrolase